MKALAKDVKVSVTCKQYDGSECLIKIQPARFDFTAILCSLKLIFYCSLGACIETVGTRTI